MKPFVEEIEDLDPLQAFLSVKHLPYSLLLDSADRKHPASRYSFVVCHPIETIESKNGKITVTNWEQRLSFSDDDPFRILSERMKAWREKTTTIHGLPPFQGGAAGLFGYDLARSLEKLPSKAKDNPNIPDMSVGIYDQVYAYDHLLRKGWIITHARNESEAQTKRKFLHERFAQEYEVPPFTAVDLEWESNFDADDYTDQVSRVIDYINLGDIFQANISQRLDAKIPSGFDPFIHYLHLRKVNPAPFAAYMNIGDVKISSASPERFLVVDKNGAVQSCPIKGTRPHVGDPSIDRAYRSDLKNSEKDKAENTMIVDLLRNDLSRVCTPESVEVSALCKLESFAGVHHLVSTVSGKLREDQTALDALRACFPGGSITGAPKIRAMEIIEEIEPQRRGPYCGSIGYIGFDGTLDTSILIRTLVYDRNTVSLQVGGGVVADSDPDAEYQETFDKAAPILHSFEEDETAATEREAFETSPESVIAAAE
ncbi:MAG: aminodeoxychorismate synthase component I [Alphaproteobacteria bacterium]|nr:aminodeoxychorismate synthase component I [Alphaproteobacteria bacterium]